MSTTPSPSTSKPTIRTAKFSELYECAQVLWKAFYDDVLFGQHIHPHRAEYPEDGALWFYRMMQSEYWDWTMVFVVSVEQDHRSGRERVTGVAQWHRLGDDYRRFGWGLDRWDPRNLLEPIAHFYSDVCSRVYPNRAIDPPKSDVLVRADPFTAEMWLVPDRRERWYLHFLGVHPEYQNKGIGRELVRWGIERAEKEEVGASVVAGYLKDRFYERCGFTEILGRSGQGEGNPLSEIPGGTVWWVGPKVDGRNGNREGEGIVMDLGWEWG